MSSTRQRSLLLDYCTFDEPLRLFSAVTRLSGGLPPHLSPTCRPSVCGVGGGGLNSCKHVSSTVLNLNVQGIFFFARGVRAWICVRRPVAGEWDAGVVDWWVRCGRTGEVMEKYRDGEVDGRLAVRSLYRL